METVPPGVDPAQFLQTIVIGLPRKVVQGIPQEMHIAALPSGFGQDLKDRLLQPGVVVGHDEFNTRQATLLQAQKEFLPTALALAVGHLDGQDLPLAVSGRHPMP